MKGLQIMSVPLSRLIADLLGASVGVWGIWNLLRKQHRLRGAARILRWSVVAVGASMFGASQHGWFGAHWVSFTLGMVGLFAACFFFGFPDISFYLVESYKNLRWRQSRASGLDNLPK